MPTKPTYDELLQQLATLEKQNHDLKRFNLKSQATTDRMASIHFEGTRKTSSKEAADLNTKLMEGLINNSSSIIYAKDEYGKYLIVNSLFEKLFNESGKEIIGKTDFDIFPEEQARIFQHNDQKVLKIKLVHQFEEIVKVNGVNHVYLTIKFPIFDINDSICAVGGMSTDISDYKQLELDLHGNSKQLNALINASPDIICFKDGKGRWLLANDADLKLFQLTGVDYKGKTDVELAPYSLFYRDAFLGCMKTDEKAWEKRELSREQEIIPTPDGEDRVFDIVKIPLFNADGTRQGLVVQGHDITELLKTEKILRQEIASRKEAEDSLQQAFEQSEEKVQERTKDLVKLNEHLHYYLDAIDNIGLGLFVVDSNYRVQDMNKTSIDWFGDHRGEICYKSIAGLEEPCSHCRLIDVMDNGKTVKYQVTTSDDKIFDIVATPLDNAAGDVNKMEIIRNVTEVEHKKVALIKANKQLATALDEITEISSLLEDKVQQRTYKLQISNEQLSLREQEVAKKNIALRVILDQQQDTRDELEGQIATLLKKRVYPYLDLLQQDMTDTRQSEYLTLIRAHLDSINASFSPKTTNPLWNLTPREMLVADLVQQGKNTLEISQFLKISIRTAEKYRHNIRKKIGLTKKKTSLYTYLNTTSLESE